VAACVGCIIPLQAIQVIREFFGNSDFPWAGGSAVRVRFGRCLFDGDSRELRRDGVPQPLSPKAFQFLELLLQERPRALTKQEIHERLWPDSFVADSSLARLAAEVRSALGDDAKAPRLLRTVHRFGYAFSGDAVAEATPRGALAQCRLVWAERQIPLVEGENLLGRASDARIVIDLARVSRHHARIVVSGGSAVLEDLGSKNGTFLRGQALQAAAELTDGDEICIGPAVLVFRTSVGNSTTETGTAA
jgi:DNA-binding winged helix-turn-helix (wHTH) protein